jgi:hypothetical protein
LRLWFTQWGLPKAIRVDNGSPWATQTDIPSALALWLIGLGVKVLLNRPRQCTDNAIVERGHGVMAQWVEPDHALTYQALQAQLNAAIRMQRECYPIRQGQSRLAAYPALAHNPRRYAPEREAAMWQLHRVHTWLAQQVWVRCVDKVGYISFFSIALSVGRAWAGQTVQLHFDPATRDWVIETRTGQFLKRSFALELTPERICNLQLAKRANLMPDLPS